MLTAMKIGFAAFAIACVGCAENATNPDYPPPTFPRMLVLDEGSATTFELGLVGGPVGGAHGGFYQGNAYCPGSKITFEPCTFDLSNDDAYPVTITLSAALDGDKDSETYDVTVYLFGEIAEPGHTMTVMVIDQEAP